jgi:hypothetical protein
VAAMVGPAGNLIESMVEKMSKGEWPRSAISPSRR